MRAERDLYRRLLELGAQDEIEPFIEAALGLVVELADACHGYLELWRRRDGEEAARFALARSGADGVSAAEIRTQLSQTVIDEVSNSGVAVVTTSAHADPRFSGSGSVQRHKIDAVLCVPIGEPLAGVIYLQGRRRAGGFSRDDRHRVETFARHLAPFVDRLFLRLEAVSADPTAPHRARLSCDSIIGRSESLARVLQQLTVVAPHDVAVILTGATGTGKTQLARVLHQSGPRAGKPFVELNCAALPDQLLENELFGAVAGGHSTATPAVAGKVGAADGGTLFLDEIGELSAAAQAKLLQFLQSGSYFPLGSATARRADVRVVAATNGDLAEAVAEGAFREDLYYRLHVIPIVVPSLAERPEDVPLLARHFCEEMCRRSRLSPLRLSPAALSALEAEEWPGNVRQLCHAVEAACLRAAADGTPEITVNHLFPAQTSSSTRSPQTFQAAVSQFKERLIRTTLADTNGNVAEAARRLDIARSYLNKLLARYGGNPRADDP